MTKDILRTDAHAAGRPDEYVIKMVVVVEQREWKNVRVPMAGQGNAVCVHAEQFARSVYDLVVGQSAHMACQRLM
jgi:hypothetical protein